MNLYFISGLLFFAVSFAGLAQEREDPVTLTLYYNLNWQLTMQENSYFRREASFNLTDMVFDGVYKDFNKDDKLMEEGYYNHGVRQGLQTEYYEDMSVKSTIEFSNGDFIIWQKATPDKKPEVIRGTGKFSMHYYFLFDLKVQQGEMHGEFLNGKKTGPWDYYDLKGNKTDTEYYNDGKLMKHILYKRGDSLSVDRGKEIILSLSSINTSRFSFDKTMFESINQYFEKYVSYPTTFSRLISFPGGIKGFLTLLSEQAEVEKNNLVLARLKLDEHGKLLKLNLVRHADEFSDERVEKLIVAYENYFFPAIEKGKPVPSVIFLPIASGDEWMTMLKEMPLSFFTDPANFE
jgi:antitoxin component YwqK of YwqJK toxin-antitoxin module